MPVSVIAYIIVRLFALYWILQSAVQTVSLTFAWSTPGAPAQIAPYIGIHLVFGVLLWFLAPRLCRLAAGKHDASVTLEGITSEQLFTATLLGLGTWFFLSSLGRTFNWLHYFATTQSDQDQFRIQDSNSYYELFESVITLGTAIALIFSARVLARKLVRDRQPAL